MPHDCTRRPWRRITRAISYIPGPLFSWFLSQLFPPRFSTPPNEHNAKELMKRSQLGDRRAKNNERQPRHAAIIKITIARDARKKKIWAIYERRALGAPRISASSHLNWRRREWESSSFFRERARSEQSKIHGTFTTRCYKVPITSELGQNIISAFGS